LIWTAKAMRKTTTPEKVEARIPTAVYEHMERTQLYAVCR